MLIIGGGIAGFLAYGTQPGLQNHIASGPGSAATSAVSVAFGVSITHQNQHSADLVWLAQMAMKGQYWSASCYVFCSHGVTYKLDPTVITSQGRGIEQCLVFGSTSTDTCTASNFPKVIGLSLSSATPAATDTYAGGAGQACSSNNEITTGGLTDIAGTVTPGANGSPVTTTIAHTFTAAETDTAVQATGLYSAINGGTNPLLYSCGTFGPDTLTSGNTLTITWTISRT